MRNILQFRINTSRASARVVDGKLILSFPEALTPVIWQMELSEAKASALEVRPGGEKGSHALTLRTARGETLEIAPFATREEAVEALMAVSRALENAHGQIRGGGVRISAPRIRGEGGGRWAAGILAVIFVFILFSVWSSLAPRPASSLRTTAPGGAVSGAPGASQAGVPLSADDYLKGM